MGEERIITQNSFTSLKPYTQGICGTVSSKMNTRRFLTVAAICGVLSLALGYRSNISGSQDIRIYERIGKNIVSVHTEDVEKVESEYPPLASIVFFFVSANIFDLPFAESWIWLLMLSMGASMWYLRKLKKTDAWLPPIALLASALFVGPEVTFARFDILIFFLLLLTWKAQEAKRHKHAAIFLVLAASMKVVPVIGLPYLLVTTPKKERKNFWKGIIWGSLLSVFLPLAVMGWSGYWSNVEHMTQYHSDRGVQIESTWSSFNLLHSKAQTAFRAMSVTNENLGADISTMGLLIMTAGLLILWWRAGRKWKHDPTMFAPLLIAAFAWTLGTSPVLSPQYLVWLVPLLILYALEEKDDTHHIRIGVLGVFIGLATQWIFPMHYGELVNQSSYAIVWILFARNIALLLVAYSIWKQLFSHRLSLPQWLRTRFARKRTRLSMRDTIVFICGICIIGGLYLQYTPHIQVAQYRFEGHETQTFKYAPMIQAESDQLHAKLYIHLSPLHPSILRVKPDDCIRSLRINNTPVRGDIAIFCDYGSGRDINLGPYLRAGTNLFEFEILDQGGVSGITVSVSRFDKVLWSLYIALFILVFWYGKKVALHHTKGKWPYAVWMTVFYGLVLRFFYFLATPPNARAYDQDGHVDYIKYVAEHFSIPNSQAGWEYHQAPIYYFMTGVWTSLASMCGRAFDLILRDYQRFALIISAAALIACVPLAAQLFPKKSDRKNSLLFLGILATFPALVYLAARITNGALYHLLAIITIVQLVVWWNEGETRAWYLTCLAAGLASIVKVSAYAFFPAMFLCLLLRKGISMREKIRMGSLGAVILIVVAGWFPLFRMVSEADHTRSVQLGNQGMNSKLLLPTTRPSDLVTFNPIRLVSIPFNNPWEDSAGRQYFLEYFFRSGFFGEFSYSDWRRALGVVILVLGILLFPVLLFGLYKESKKKQRYESLPMLLVFFCLMASSIWYRINFPYGSNSDFRFVAPVILPIAYFIVKGIGHLPAPVRSAAYKTTVALCGVSTVFLISLYWL